MERSCAAVGHKNADVPLRRRQGHYGRHRRDPRQFQEVVRRRARTTRSREKALAHLEKAWWPRFSTSTASVVIQGAVLEDSSGSPGPRVCGRRPRSNTRRWASQSDVRFIVLKRNDTLALIASRWRKDKMHEASKAFGTTNGVGRSRATRARRRGAPSRRLPWITSGTSAASSRGGQIE